MKRYQVFLWIAVCAFLIPSTAAAAPADRLSGRILLQVESHGEAWYVFPVNNLRYYLGRPADAFAVMRGLGLGISEADYTRYRDNPPARLLGRIVLRVQAHGEAYYADPVKKVFAYLGRPADAFGIMREDGLGISNADLAAIPIAGDSAPLPGSDELSEAYDDPAGVYSIRYPADYRLDTAYQYEGLGPGQAISGVKLLIPTQLSNGTNLSSFDTGVSVEELPGTTDCTAAAFLYSVNATSTVTDNGITYSYATSSDVGAGNFYEEQVWAIPGTAPCLAVRYFIHSTNIGNYPPGTVMEFDRQALLGQFDRIRRSLAVK